MNDNDKARLTRPRPVRESISEMTEIVLPNDANPLNALLGGRLMHWIDLAGAMAAHRHSRTYVVTASIDHLDFKVPGEDVDFDNVPGLQTVVDKWTALYAATSDKHDAAAFAKLPAEKQISARGIEVGQVFYFGTKYSEPMKALVTGPDGAERPVHMGSYGIGPTRLVAALIEVFHDDAGIKWPEAVAPFTVAILNLKQGASETDAACEHLYAALTAKGIDTLYDDLDERPGAKFATADLIGIPWQILVGPRGLAEGKVEVKRRSDGSRELTSPADALARLIA